MYLPTTPPPLPKKSLFIAFLELLRREDIEKLSAQKSVKKSAQTHLFEAKNGSKERRSSVEGIERKLSSTSK